MSQREETFKTRTEAALKQCKDGVFRKWAKDIRKAKESISSKAGT